MMQRTITVVSAATGASADVRLDTSGERMLVDVVDDLATLTGGPAAPVTRDGIRLDERMPLAHLHDGDVVVLAADPTTAPGSQSSPDAVVEVVAGPDAGRRLLLGAGRHVLGRDATALHSSDSAISRAHLQVVVDRDAVSVSDLDSVNGTWVGDGPVPPRESVPWPPATEVRIGATVLVHGRERTAPAAVTPGADGALLVNRPPRLTPPTDAATIPFPTPPQPPVTTTRLPVLASAAPLLAGVVLAALLHRWEFLAFALMSPLVMIGQAASDRLAARRDRRRGQVAYASAVAAAEEALAAAMAAERRARHTAAPDLAQVAASATHRTGLLWQRAGDDTDALVLRIGVGDVPATTTTVGGPHPLVAAGVPVTVDLRRTPVVGIAAADDGGCDLARSLLLQAVVLHGPAEVQVSIIALRRSTSWQWTRWLPHLRDASGTGSRLFVTPEQARAHLAELATRPGDEHHLVLVDGLDDPTAAANLAGRADTHVVWLADSRCLLPAACDAIVSIAGRTQFVLTQGDGDDLRGVPDLVPVDVAEQVARALAPLRDARSATMSVPASVPWSEVHELPLHDVGMVARELTQRWARGPSTVVRLGMGAGGVVQLDLRTDGPHALVAGTTGAGKSELLRSLVASLVAGNAPADLRLLLVDYKGGTAFGGFAELPHTLDVLTDLDPSTTSRALRALTAELRRRERLLADVGAADLDEWRAQMSRRGQTIALPRLVIVVDEFATLADELPDFLGGLIAVAQRGRALGVHLVLATQRPEGAVSADIRANTRLRVCLAVAREAESRDVIDSPRATTISRTTPGRALVRIGGHELLEVQTARVSAPVRAQDAGVSVVPACAWSQHDDERRPDDVNPSELDVLMSAASMAAAALDATDASLWLPPLPTSVRLADLASDSSNIAIGVVDLPDEQRQPLLLLDAPAPLLITGTGRSGRTTAAVSVVTALAATHSPDDLHVYALDSGHALRDLVDLPHVGAAVDASDAERAERLLLFLTAQVQSRRGATSHGREQIVLVVDSWDGVLAAAGDVDGGRLQDMLLRLIKDGPGAGLMVVVTSDRAGLMGKLSSTIANRICLRLADVGDYAAIGMPAREAPRSLPPGRGIRASDHALVQLAVTDEATVARARGWPVPVRRPRRFDPLPSRVSLRDARRGAGEGVVIGVRSDDLAPALIDPAQTTGAFLVAGPPRSGRSTTLLSIAAQVHPADVVALCARTNSDLRAQGAFSFVGDATAVDDVETAVAAVAAGSTLLVDDVDLVDDTAVLNRLEDAVRCARNGSGFVVLAGTADAMTASFRGPVAQARRARAGLLLRPSGSNDGELLGVRLRRRSAHADPPGRGLLAVNGAITAVQVPDPR